MRPLLLAACLIVFFASCTKINPVPVTDYTAKKGTVTITTPDTTYTFTTPGDQVYFSSGDSYFNIACYRDNLTSFNITSTDKVSANSLLNIYEFHLYGLYQNTSQVYTNTTATNIGMITLTDLNTNGNGVTGSFIANIAKASNGSQTGTQHYTITGKFNLN
jgi:hypothetical protein